MKKTKDKIREIIKKSYEGNYRSINWSGMHDSATEQIMKILRRKIDNTIQNDK